MSGSTAAVVTSRMLHRQRRVVERFVAAGATSPDQAVSRSEIAGPESMAFNQLARAGVLVMHANDRWYADPATWEQFRSRQRHRMLAAAFVITVIAGGVVVLLAIL